MSGEILMGNGAVARGLIEAGCHAVTGYPGTPSSEIMPEVVRFKKMHGLNIYTEWSVNEKVALETAVSFAWSGKRVAVVMKQVGLNVAADPIMSAAYTGTIGGMLVISCDDPGPHSSQTEQDTRYFAGFAKIPVLDPSSPEEAREMVSLGFDISEKYQVPVILRPSIRICHARQWIDFREPALLDRQARFIKEPGRWAATPKFRLELHRKLNEKLDAIAVEEGTLSNINRIIDGNADSPLGIVAGGPPLAHLRDLLQDLKIRLPILAVGLAYPMNRIMMDDFLNHYEHVLVLEEPGEVIEKEFTDRTRVLGRASGHVPRAGELSPEIVGQILGRAMDLSGIRPKSLHTSQTGEDALQDAVRKILPPPRRPTLCPGCPHRSAFFAIRKAIPKAIYTSDIGCYTLGINLRVVDTCLNMGAAVSMASGFYQAYRQSGQDRPVVATIGDSTFLHSGMTGLLNAVYTDSRFILVILDNAVTAMTGMQPAISTGELADGSQGKPVKLEDAVKGCGVEWLKVVEPYDFEAMKNTLQEALEFTRTEEGGVAVIISRAPCLIHDRSAKKRWKGNKVSVDGNACIGCGSCVNSFECPALLKHENKVTIQIDRTLCIDCGSCRWACKQGALNLDLKD
ncbi:MAG: thiamine pyrophosphate-dependent enzyme [Planctomycetota bacterium]